MFKLKAAAGPFCAVGDEETGRRWKRSLSACGRKSFGGGGRRQWDPVGSVLRHSRPSRSVTGWMTTGISAFCHGQIYSYSSAIRNFDGSLISLSGGYPYSSLVSLSASLSEKMSLAEQSASFVAHLQDIQDNPSKPLDPSILESYELVLQSSGAAQQVETLQKVFIFIAQLLPTLQQDPSPLVRVALKASAPLTYDHIAHVNLLPGLELIATPFHELIISLLDKAANANDIVRLAAQPEVIHSLVILWLCAQNIKTSELASELLLRYLRVSKNRPASLDQETAPKYGQGPMWKRLFGDKDIYELFFGICTLDPALKMFVISKNDRTVAQSRLMDWIPQVGTLDWDTILHSQHPSVSQKYGLSANEGLLAFAATKMVDTNDDILMHIRLLEFYKQLLECLPQLTTGYVIYPLVFLHAVRRELSFATLIWRIYLCNAR